MAVKKEATPSQIALACLLAQKPFIVPIPGTLSEDHLNENLGANSINITPRIYRKWSTSLNLPPVSKNQPFISKNNHLLM